MRRAFAFSSHQHRQGHRCDCSFHCWGIFSFAKLTLQKQLSKNTCLLAPAVFEIVFWHSWAAFCAVHLLGATQCSGCVRFRVVCLHPLFFCFPIRFSIFSRGGGFALSVLVKLFCPALKTMLILRQIQVSEFQLVSI